MPTDFMNRRMDLIHSVFDAGPGVGLVNYLTMDTSYPVKLSGKVIKIFKASDVYNDGMWVIVNAADQGILTIKSRNLYDFSGNVIENCVGEEKLYPTSEDVYKADDYVVIIIDFDNESAKICSQTMFNYIFTNVGVSDVNLKMFDISGTDIVSGIDDPLSEEELDKAVSFESGDGTFALVRRNSSDKVVFQAMEQDSDGNYRYVPVADVNNKNINGFNVSALSLLYPSINTGYVNTFCICSALRSMMQLNGKVNEKFVQDFCYTYDELQTFLAGPGSLLEAYSKYYYNNIPDAYKNNYYYFIMDSAAKDDPNYAPTVKALTSRQMIIPILRETLKFNTVDFSGPGIQTSNLQLNMLFSQLSGNMVGNWWADGFDPTQDTTMSIWSTPQTVRYTDDSADVNVYAFDISRISSVFGRRFYLTDYISSAPSILSDGVAYYETMDSQYPNVDTTQKYLVSPDELYEEEIYVTQKFLGDISYYTDFFSNNDYKYKDYIRYDSLRGPYPESAYMFRSSNTEDVMSSPINVAMACSEYIKNYVFSSNSLWNLCYNENIDKDRVCYDITNEGDITEAYYMLYVMSFYPASFINNFSNKLNYMKGRDNNIRKVGSADDKFIFKVTGDFLLRSNATDSSPFGICTHKTASGDTINYLVYQFVKMMPKAIAYVDVEGTNRYLADMSFIIRAYADEIKFAKADFDDHIEYINENGTYYLFHVSKSGVDTPLYITKCTAEGGGSLLTINLVRASYEEIKNAINFNGTVFLYMGASGKEITDSENNVVYRMRYYTDFDNISSYGSHDTDPNDAFTGLDFFTKPVQVCDKNTGNGYPCAYDKAYAAIRSDVTDSDALLTAVRSTSLSDRVTEVELHYRLYKNGSTYGIMNHLNADNIPVVAHYTHPSDWRIGSDTILLATLYDRNIRDYRKSTDTTLMDILPNGAIPYTDGPAPSLSRIKDKNGSFIINSASYIDFISNVFVTKETANIPNNITGDNPIPPILSESQLKYINGVGVREEYYQNKTIFEFFNNLTMYDVTKPSETQKNDAVKVNRYPIYPKGAFNSIVATQEYKDFWPMFVIGGQERFETNANFKIPSGTTINAYSSAGASTPSTTIAGDESTWQVVSDVITSDKVQIRKSSTTYWVLFKDIAEQYTGFKDSNGTQVKMNCPASIVSKINFRSNKYGFNDAYIYSGTMKDTQDLTNYYISVDKIYASTEKAGEKQVTNVSLCDENGIPLNLNGILGTIEVDDLNWDALMTALSSNKTIDILSVLKKIKGDLNRDVINATQNITDTITYANNIDNVASIGTKADFDSETNLYTYHDGEGYSGNIKEQNHRGVIVLVTEGGKTTLVNGVPVTTNPTIHVKRMYISKDGLLCTKEFYDAEKAIGKSLLERLHDLDHLG